MRKILHSRSNAALLDRAASFVAERRSECLIIAPTRAAAAEFAIRAFPSGCQGVHALTFPQLAANLATQSMGRLALAPISRLGAEALAARIIHSAATSNQLAYFAPVARTPGFGRALARTLNELRLQDVGARDLATTGAPGRDLAHLLNSYEGELQRRAIADLALVLRLAAEEAALGCHRFTQVPMLLLGIAIESAAHERLLATLVEQSPAVLATAISNDDAIASLERILGTRAEDLNTQAPASTLGRVRTWVFSSDPPASAPPDPALLFSAPGESFECVEIARRIHAVAQEGTQFDRMAILLRNVDAYQPLVEEALRRAGIDHYFSRGAARPDPAGRAFLALLACANERCSASRFAEYLSLGQTPPLAPDGSPQPAEPQWVPADDEMLAVIQAPPPGSELPSRNDSPDAVPLDVPIGWEKLLVDAAVIGGRDRWARRLRGLRAELQAQLRDLEKDDEAHRAHTERRIQQLTALEHFALPLIDTLATLPSSASWGTWLDQLTQLASAALRRPESVLGVLAELEPMREVGPVSLDEVYDVLSERLGFLRTEPPKRRYGRVFVGSIEEARGRSFDIVFLPGLAEGLFPRRAIEDPLLLDEHRAKLASSLDTQDQRIARERMLLRYAAAAASVSMIVSYPRMDIAQSRARVPSFYALEVMRAAEGRLPSLREFEKRAARAASSRLAWPAPADAREAIDDAEYDLASLEASLKLRGDRAQGSARYLMQTNDALARSFRARWRRWEASWSSADGFIHLDAATLRALAAHRLANRAYSPSALQHFAACPYRFVLQAIFQFRAREQSAPLEQMDPLTRGALFHAAQFELFRTLESANLLPVTPDRLSAALDLADQVLDRVAAKYEDDLAPAIARVWNSEIETIRMDIRGWLQQVAAAHDHWIPAHFEFAFGLPADAHRDRSSTNQEAVIFDSIRLRGSIDLIERHSATGVFRITDHKTGKAPKERPQYVGGGAVLQPLLYAHAAETLLGAPVQSGRLYFCTQRGDFAAIEIPLNEQARDRLRRVLETIDQSIETGFLPAAPQSGACAMCDYSAVCGPYEEIRVKKKRRDRLDPLLQLRSLP